jgi:hypothetical protein
MDVRLYAPAIAFVIAVLMLWMLLAFLQKCSNNNNENFVNENEPFINE